MFVYDLRKYKDQYNEQKMPGPDVQQLPGGGGLTSYSFCTSPLYFAWVYLSYLMPSHFIVILSLSPCILFYFFRGSTPRQETRIIDYMSLFINYILYTCLYIGMGLLWARDFEDLWEVHGSRCSFFVPSCPRMLVANDIAARSHLYDIYIYICIPQKFHPAGSQETKHIAHAQRETT